MMISQLSQVNWWQTHLNMNWHLRLEETASAPRDVREWVLLAYDRCPEVLQMHQSNDKSNEPDTCWLSAYKAVEEVRFHQTERLQYGYSDGPVREWNLPPSIPKGLLPRITCNSPDNRQEVISEISQWQILLLMHFTWSPNERISRSPTGQKNRWWCLLNGILNNHETVIY